MTKVRHFLKGMLGILLATTLMVNAEETNNNLDAHVHGLSELTIAMDNEELEIQFISPSMNIVGFEYQATTQSDIAAVKQAANVLSNHQRHFVFSNNECRHIETEVNVSALLAGNGSEHPKHNEDQRKAHHKAHQKEGHSSHDDHHEHAKKAHHDDHGQKGHHKQHGHHKDHHDSHGHQKKTHKKHNHGEEKHSEHKHADRSVHSEIVANYEYRCKMRSPLEAVTINLFDSFPGIQKINVVWANQMKQGAVKLTPDNKTVNF